MKSPHRRHLTNLVGALSTSVSDDMRVALEQELGLVGSGPAALLAVDTWPESSIDFLRGVLGLSHSGAVRVVDNLVSAGLARRATGTDRRTVAIRLTSAGRNSVQRARRVRERVLSDVVGGLDSGERQSLLDLLQRALRTEPRSRTQARQACRLCDHSVCRGDTCPIGASVHVE